MGSGGNERADPRRVPAPRGVRPASRVPESSGRSDRAARWLDHALAVYVFALPLPFGAVGRGGRLFVELGALVLLGLWLAIAPAGRPRPPGPVLAAVLGLLALGALQALPLPRPVVAAVNPRAAEIRREVEAPPAVVAAERAVLGTDAPLGAPRSTLSLDPQATASALRTGAALGALVLVGGAVAASRGVDRLALALLLSAAFQGLYGLLTLASGHDRIWNVPKLYNLDSSTGTFVNANHYAAYTSLALACGAALVLRNARRTFLAPDRLRRLGSLGREGGRDLLLALLLVCGLGGLLTSNSRAGIALGLLALTATVLAVGRASARTRLALVALLALAACVPLLVLGPESLVQSFAASGQELRHAGGRLTVWRDTTRIVAAFPVVGSGLGTFAAVYPLFRSGDVREFYQHAHLEPLQLAAEAGIAGLLLAGLLVAPVSRGVARGLRAMQGSLAPGLAAGLAAVALHSLIEFPLRLPAIAATAAVVAGALLVEPWSETRSA